MTGKYNIDIKRTDILLQNEEKIQVYYLNINEIKSKCTFEAYYECMPNIRKKKVDSFLYFNDRCRALCSGILLMEALREKNLLYIDENFEKGRYGKPYFQCAYNQYFNISHSGEWVMAVFANTEIGCDIEHIEKCDSDIVKSYFTDLEREYINKFSGDMYHYASYTIWTLKESFLKAIGVGLNKSMQTFSVVNREGAIKKLIQSDEKEYCLFTKNNMLYSVSICVEINEKKGKK